MELDDITGEIVDAAIQIHRDPGPGLLESLYEDFSPLSSGDVGCTSTVNG